MTWHFQTDTIPIVDSSSRRLYSHSQLELPRGVPVSVEAKADSASRISVALSPTTASVPCCSYPFIFISVWLSFAVPNSLSHILASQHVIFGDLFVITPVFARFSVRFCRALKRIASRPQAEL